MSFITDRLNGLTSVNCFQAAELEQILIIHRVIRRDHNDWGVSSYKRLAGIVICDATEILSLKKFSAPLAARVRC
jgi:hypothetical protein